MPIATMHRPREVEFSIVHGAKPAGRSIGQYAGQAIPEAIRDDFGNTLTFAGVAPRRLDGEFDVDALQPGEFIVKPGLIYKRIS
jgi:hypothetical protein